MVAIIDVLKDTNVGGFFLLNQQKEPSLVMKLPEGVSFDATTPIGYGVFEWYEYDPEGVIIRTLVQIYKDLQHLQQPLVYFDTFMNPNNEDDKQLLSFLAKASFLWCLAWSNDADLTFLGQKKLRWQDAHRQDIARLLKLSNGTSTMWPASKIRCMRDHPIDS